jgi:hypothetical protein
VTVDDYNEEKLGSFKLWLERDRPGIQFSMTYLEVIGPNPGESIIPPHLRLESLPCPQLRELRLQHIAVQLGSGEGHPSVLQGCTCLTALHLHMCNTFRESLIPTTSGAQWNAAILVLTELRSLRLHDHYKASSVVLMNMWRLSKLTDLDLAIGIKSCPAPLYGACLHQLSALANLEDLVLAKIPTGKVSDSLPSELVKLTHLDLEYSGTPSDSDIAEQFKHISCLTLLQGLSFEVGHRWHEPPGLALSLIGHIPWLTSLSLAHFRLNSTSTSSFTGLTALESLHVQSCNVPAAALAALTQLCALSLDYCGVRDPADESMELLLQAVSKLLLLMQLRVWQTCETPPPMVDLIALTASNSLRSLQISLGPIRGESSHLQAFTQHMASCSLFGPTTTCPNLQHIDLTSGAFGCMPVNGEQVRELCNCCPALTEVALQLVLEQPPSVTAYKALQQLSALTHLRLYNVSTAVAAVVHVAVQLTGLKKLMLHGVSRSECPALLQLTALTALEALEFRTRSIGLWPLSRTDCVRFVNTVSAYTSDQPGHGVRGCTHIQQLQRPSTQCCYYSSFGQHHGTAAACRQMAVLLGSWCACKPESQAILH